MKSLLDQDAPAEVQVTGQRIAGAVSVSYALTSALTRTVRFGDHCFGRGQLIIANGCEYDICLTIIEESPGVWKADRFDGIRRPVEQRIAGRDPSEAAKRSIRLWAETRAAELGRDYPEAFIQYGHSDRGDALQYATGTVLKSAAQRLADDALLLYSYAEITQQVDDGSYKIVPVDGPNTRWKHCESMRNMPGPVDCPQPAKIVGHVVDGATVVGYAIDARSRSSYGDRPCTYNGPMICPIEHATISDR